MGKQQELCCESTQLQRGMQHVQGEFAWKTRLHPSVRNVFEHAYGTTDLSCSMDVPSMFYTPKGTRPQKDNDQWLHVDQNFHTGITHQCYQGVLYIHATDADS